MLENIFTTIIIANFFGAIIYWISRKKRKNHPKLMAYEIKIAQNIEKESNGLDELKTLIDEESKALELAIKSTDNIKETSIMINEIATVIEEISSASHVMALNSAIEAARAGEQGAGFAAVSNDFINLTKKSTEKYRDLKEIIQDIRKEAEKANNNLKIIKTVSKKIQKINSTTMD